MALESTRLVTSKGIVSLFMLLHDASAARMLVLSEVRMIWSKDRSGVTWCGIRDSRPERPTPADMETLLVHHSHIGLEVGMATHQSRKDVDSSGSTTASLWI